MEKTKVKLRICDIDCTITSDDNEEYVRTLGNEIDCAISAVLKKNNRVSLSMAAIITAMTYCDESAKAKAELAERKTLDKNRASEYEHLKQIAQAAQAEAKQLRSELQTLHAFLTEDKDLEKMPGLKGMTPITGNHAVSKQNLIFRCINGKSAYVLKSEEEPQEENIIDIPVAPVSMEDAHTLEELCNSINVDGTAHTADNPLEGVPSTVIDPQVKQSKQNSLRKNQSKKVQKAAKKEDRSHTPPYSPVQRAEHPVHDLLTGSYTHPKSPLKPNLPSDDTFMGYFQA